MVDSIQATSTLPLPNYQTTQGSQDPLPLNGQEQISNDTQASQIQAKDISNSDFETYLNATAILHQEEDKKSAEFDTAQQITNSSIYKPPGTTQPI